MTSNADPKPVGYRWVVLAAYSVLSIAIEIQWLTFAPIASAARSYYQVSSLPIDLLSLVYMIVFIFVCIPASYVIDTYGLKIGVGIGAVLTGIFGLMKGVFASDYTLVLIAQIGLATAQPFILNAVTKIGVIWFPLGERATAAGIATLSQYMGFIVAMILTPHLIASPVPGTFDLGGMLMVYGIASLVAAVGFLVLMRDHPSAPPSAADQGDRFKVFQGLRLVLKNRDMLLMLGLFFLGLGMFNAISTCIEKVCRGLTVDQAGIVGGAMLIGGIAGAIVLPAISDRIRRRKRVFVLCTIGMLPGVVGLTFLSGFIPLLLAAGCFGFFLLSAGPIGFQYGAELARPAPESTVQGLLLLAGQISGILFVIAVDKAGISASMAAFVVMSVMIIVFAALMKESPLMVRPAPLR